MTARIAVVSTDVPVPPQPWNQFTMRARWAISLSSVLSAVMSQGAPGSKTPKAVAPDGRTLSRPAGPGRGVGGGVGVGVGVEFRLFVLATWFGLPANVTIGGTPTIAAAAATAAPRRNERRCKLTPRD